MKPDAILQEIYAVRQKLAAAVGYDAARFFAEIQRLQDLHKAQGVKYVSFARKTRTPATAGVATVKPRRPSRRQPATCTYPDTPTPALSLREKPGKDQVTPSSRHPKKEKSRH